MRSLILSPFRRFVLFCFLRTMAGEDSTARQKLDPAVVALVAKEVLEEPDLRPESKSIQFDGNRLSSLGIVTGLLVGGGAGAVVFVAGAAMFGVAVGAAAATVRAAATSASASGGLVAASGVSLTLVSGVVGAWVGASKTNEVHNQHLYDFVGGLFSSLLRPRF